MTVSKNREGTLLNVLVDSELIKLTAVPINLLANPLASSWGIIIYIITILILIVLWSSILWRTDICTWFGLAKEAVTEKPHCVLFLV